MSNLTILKESNIASFIYFIRGEKVMLDVDLDKPYKVETRAGIIGKNVKDTDNQVLMVGTF